MSDAQELERLVADKVCGGLPVTLVSLRNYRPDKKSDSFLEFYCHLAGSSRRRMSEAG
jgi:hypothetical protein